MKFIAGFHAIIWTGIVFLYSNPYKKDSSEILYNRYIAYNACIYLRNCYIFEIIIYNLFEFIPRDDIDNFILHLVIIFCKLEIYDSLPKNRIHKKLNFFVLYYMELLSFKNYRVFVSKKREYIYRRFRNTYVSFYFDISFYRKIGILL